MKNLKFLQIYCYEQMAISRIMSILKILTDLCEIRQKK